MQKWRWDAVAFLTTLVLVLSFFWKFLDPVPQLLVTPDFGRSDAWHFSFPTKFLLSQSLKAGLLPVWSGKLGTGFPVLAEGQTGTFFLPNLFLYKFLDPVIAYNMSFIFVAIMTGWGTYVFLRMLKVSRLAAWFGGITFAFSGLVMTQLPHITLLQGFSLLPWVLITTKYLIRKKSFVAMGLLAVIVSEQVFAGFPQASVITMLFAGGYILYCAMVRENYSKLLANHSKDISFWPIILRFTLAIVLALGLSAIQLLPSLEFLQQSSARGGFSPQDAAYFSYPLKHLITFLDPFHLGNPKLGTYPAFSVFDGSIFWENSGYIGIVPLVIIVLSLLVSLRSRGFKLVNTGCWFGCWFFLALCISFLLMLGSHSPLYLVYSVWPFNLFRVPSRFLWVFVFCLIVLAAWGIDRIQTRFTKQGLAKIVLLIVLFANTLILMKTWNGYQALEPAGVWLAAPATMKYIVPADRIYTIGAEVTHNETFLKTGWKDMKPFNTLRSDLAPDSNVYWNITSTQVYAGRFLWRQALVTSLLTSIIPTDVNEATMSAAAKKVFNIFGGNKIVSTVPVDAPEIMGIGTGNIRVYKNPASVGRTYLAHKTVIAHTFEEAVNTIQEDSFVPGTSVLVEQPVDIPESRDGGETEITKETDTTVTIAVRANSAVSILVLADTYYPGWKAFVDGREANIFPVNINERGVVVNPGNHTVTFVYDPQSFRVGALLSAITLTIIVTGFLRSFFVSRTHLTISSPKKHPLRNRGTSHPHTA